MYCSQCGKEPSPDDIFCNQCGIQITSDIADNNEAKGDDEDANDFFDAFTRFISSDSKLRTKYVKETPDETWDVLVLLGNHFYSNFLDNNSDELNELQYKTTEYLETAFQNSLVAGYWCWITEKHLANQTIGPFEKINTDDTLSRIQEIFGGDGFQNNIDALSKDVEFTVNAYHRLKSEDIMESAPELKSLIRKTVESLKTTLVIVILCGYYVGHIQDEYRK